MIRLNESIANLAFITALMIAMCSLTEMRVFFFAYILPTYVTYVSAYIVTNINNINNTLKKKKKKKREEKIKTQNI